MNLYFKKAIILLIVILFCQCKNKDIIDCNDFKYQRVYAERIGRNGEISYEHYVLILGYSNRCFPLVDFSDIAKLYKDTCNSFIPVGALSFLKSTDDIGFENNELNPVKIAEHEIIGFGMDSLSITSVFITNGEVRKVVQIKDCEWKESY